MLRRARKHFHEHVDEDIETLPLMNLFVALIPMLLISAVFLEVAVMKMNVPSDASAAELPAESRALAIAIGEDSWIVTRPGTAAIEVARSDADAEQRLQDVLAAAVASEPDEKDVTIASQSATRYQDIVHVMDAARGAGLSNVSLTRTRGAHEELR